MPAVAVHMGASIGTALGWAQLAALIAVVGWAAWTDARTQRIANGVSIAGALLGLGLSFARSGWAGGPAGLRVSLAMMGLAFVVFFMFYLVGGMGAGDVKLMGAVGALSADGALLAWIVAYTALAGVPLAVYALWRRGDVAGGVGRSLRQMARLRFPTPPPDGRPPPKSNAVIIRASDALESSPSPPDGGDGRGGGGHAQAPPAPTLSPQAEEGRVVGADGNEKPAPVFVPYAVAIAAGVGLAVLQYVRRGATLPFFL